MDSSHGLSTIVQSEAKVLLDRYGNSMSGFEFVRQIQPVLPNLCGNIFHSDGLTVATRSCLPDEVFGIQDHETDVL